MHRTLRHEYVSVRWLSLPKPQRCIAPAITLHHMFAGDDARGGVIYSLHF